MNLYDFYKTIALGVAQDSDLSTWATNLYSSGVTVFMGLPSDNFPDMDDDPPFVALSEPYRQSSQRRGTITYGCAAWIGLSATGTKDGNPVNLIEPVGLEQVLDCQQLVRLAIAAVLPGGVYLDPSEEFADVNAVDTEVLAHMELTFTQRLTIGQSPME
jgi:hypothetical protein